MSVINQMLKDLDERKPEQQGSPIPQTTVGVPSGQKRGWALIILIIVIINVLGWFVWHIYQENQALKAQQANTSQQAVVNTSKKIVETAVIEKQEQLSTQTKEEASLVAVEEPKQQTQLQPKVTEVEVPKTQPARSESQIEQKPSLATVATNNQAKVQEVVTSNVENVTESPIKIEKAKPTMSVARKQLSPQELIAKKVEQAENAIVTNQPLKAESLYEEILVIDGHEHEVRKQLAALWYGRKAYQSALNLLQQGSAIDYNNSEFRLMKARIYLTMGQAANALNELLVLKDVQQVEYQAMIATTAQQLQQIQEAVYAYEKLTQLQPNDGRWWLGLAIAHDTDAKFELAINAYKKAILLPGISNSSMAFARQRIQELGE